MQRYRFIVRRSYCDRDRVTTVTEGSHTAIVGATNGIFLSPVRLLSVFVGENCTVSKTAFRGVKAAAATGRVSRIKKKKKPHRTDVSDVRRNGFSMCDKLVRRVGGGTVSTNGFRILAATRSAAVEKGLRPFEGVEFSVRGERASDVAMVARCTADDCACGGCDGTGGGVGRPADGARKKERVPGRGGGG